MIRAALALLAVAHVAHAEAITLPNTKATIDLPQTWKTATADGVVLGAKGPAGEVLAITRSQVPNPDAWRSKKRDVYLDQIEKGVAAKVKGYKRVTRKLDVTTVPTLDLEAKRDDGATIVMRILLFRTYALALAVEVPKRASTTDARAIVTTFTPPSSMTSETSP
ncbi:MAG: hypothetical protein M4D80_20465 [Myxococcota bacterium]|nr:hypothetical protein [Myxococcota bacterium]